MLSIKYILFLLFGLTSFIIFYIGFLNFLTSEDHFMSVLILIFASILSVGTFIGTVIVSKSISSPIENLAKNMTGFSTNNTQGKKVKSNVKEIHTLAENFENMIKQVNNTLNIEREYIEKLKEIDKQKDEFSSMISHELKTPLVPILGYVKMLKKENMLGRLNPQQCEAIDEIYEATQKLQTLIGDILTAQKLELGKLTISKEDFELEGFLNNIISNFKPLMKEKNISLYCNYKNNLTINTDKTRLEQVFSNLIKNASNFVRQKEGEIEVGMTEGKNNLHFYVKDNGIGISKLEQKNIFKKFYQTDTSYNRKKDGSGLGLSICKGIIETLGGKIWVESTPNVGATFYFTLPKSVIKLPAKQSL